MYRIDVSKEEANWGMFCHLSGLAGLFFPFGNIIGPAVIYAMKKDEFEFVDDQGKEALNFQITMSLALLISGLLVLVLIGIVLLAVVGLYAIVMTIIGAIKASEGERYRYPFTIRFIK